MQQGRCVEEGEGGAGAVGDAENIVHLKKSSAGRAVAAGSADTATTRECKKNFIQTSKSSAVKPSVMVSHPLPSLPLAVASDIPGTWSSGARG